MRLKIVLTSKKQSNMKTLLSAPILIVLFISLPYSIQLNKTTVTKCVKITCKETTYVTSITGANDADITNQIKTRYPNCSFEFLPKSKCKN